VSHLLPQNGVFNFLEYSYYFVNQKTYSIVQVDSVQWVARRATHCTESTILSMSFKSESSRPTGANSRI